MFTVVLLLTLIGDGVQTEFPVVTVPDDPVAIAPMPAPGPATVEPATTQTPTQAEEVQP
jgi:hypothetical protein